MNVRTAIRNSTKRYAIAGIAIGSVLGAILLAYILVYFLAYRRGKLQSKFFNAIYLPLNALLKKKE